MVLTMGQTRVRNRMLERGEKIKESMGIIFCKDLCADKVVLELSANLPARTALYLVARELVLHLSIAVVKLGQYNKHLHRTAKARFQVERVSPMMMFQIGVNRAGGVYFCWRGVGVEPCRMAKAIRAAGEMRR